MLAIDLDHFKDINDTLGHHIGDGLISVVAQRLVHAVRREDLVARLGGDEFAVITTEAPDPESLERFAERLIAILRAPYTVSGHTLLIGASIGIATIEGKNGDAADIMRRADVALYRAKNEGRSRACIYDADMDADLRERKQLENDLRARDRRGRAERRLSADHERERREDGRRRGALPLASSGARRRPARRFHPDRRAQRADHPARRMGAAQGLPRGEALEGADASRSTSRRCSSAARISSRWSSASSPRPSSIRSGSSWS